MTRPLSPSGLAAAVLVVACVALPVTLPRQDDRDANTACASLNAPTASPGLAVLERCFASHPRDTQAMVALGDAFRRVGEDRRAEDVYRAVLRVDAGYAEVRVRVARLLLDHHDFGAAAVEINAALLIQPNRRELQDLLVAAQRGQTAAP